MSWQLSFCSHVLWSSIEHLTRWCHHPRRCDDSHCSGVEGYAPWEEKSGSDWAQSPQRGAAARQLNHRWCWDAWLSRISAGLLGAEALVTVTYTRNEVEAATKHDIHTQGYFAVKIPSNVTNISAAAFQNSHQPVLLTIPESVTHIGKGAFEGCTSLASVFLGESVTQIGDFAFQGCTSLASLTLGKSVTAIGDGAFHGCTSLASMTLGKSVTEIGSFVFYDCPSLVSITIPESLRYILDRALGGDRSVQSSRFLRGRAGKDCARSECTDLFWCHLANDWYNLRKTKSVCVLHPFVVIRVVFLASCQWIEFQWLMRPSRTLGSIFFPHRRGSISGMSVYLKNEGPLWPLLPKSYQRCFTFGQKTHGFSQNNVNIGVYCL